MVRTKNKGWKGEPRRHALAARGIKTNTKIPKTFTRTLHSTTDDEEPSWLDIGKYDDDEDINPQEKKVLQKDVEKKEHEKENKYKQPPKEWNVKPTPLPPEIEPEPIGTGSKTYAANSYETGKKDWAPKFVPLTPEEQNYFNMRQQLIKICELYGYDWQEVAKCKDTDELMEKYAEIKRRHPED